MGDYNMCECGFGHIVTNWHASNESMGARSKIYHQNIPNHHKSHVTMIGNTWISGKQIEFYNNINDKDVYMTLKVCRRIKLSNLNSKNKLNFMLNFVVNDASYETVFVSNVIVIIEFGNFWKTSRNGRNIKGIKLN